MNARYYISTGAKSNYYTLRHAFDEHVADLRLGKLVSARAAEILIDKNAKFYGRRNSKAYAQAHAELLKFFTPAIKP